VLCCAVACREVEGPPPDDYPESDEDAVQQQQHLREHNGSAGSFTSSTFSSSGTHDPLGDLTWPLETSKTVSRGASSQLLAIGQGMGSSAAAAAAAAASAAGAGITSLLANRGKSTERQRPATSVSSINATHLVHQKAQAIRSAQQPASASKFAQVHTGQQGNEFCHV
jgi:hypothetical protein